MDRQLCDDEGYLAARLVYTRRLLASQVHGMYNEDYNKVQSEPAADYMYSSHRVFEDDSTKKMMRHVKGS